jgi:xanthine dehydrogenase accessory factor
MNHEIHQPGSQCMRGLNIVIKGAGEQATGIAHRLHHAGLTRILMTDIAEPLAVRRTVAFSESIYEGKAEVEGVRAVFLQDINDIHSLWEQKIIPVLVDPEGHCIKKLRPHVVVDAIMAKSQSATSKEEAPLVIGVGPGFISPDGVHAIIESNRGHNLGKVIYSGSAEPFTGKPGATLGYTTERVLRAPHAGKVRHVRQIADTILQGATILYVDETPIIATIDGTLRGLIRDIVVKEREKIGDIDPRGRTEHCYTISDKARAIGGGVLEAIMADFNNR